MRVIVCGGRNFYDADMVEAYLDMLHFIHRFDLIIHGAQRGADALAGSWARRHHINEAPHRANWNELGRSAGPIRNGEMLMRRPHMVIAFPGGYGTRNMVNQATDNGVKVINLKSDTVRSLIQAQYQALKREDTGKLNGIGERPPG